MNRSRNSNSTGFVYFNVNNSFQNSQSDNSDYLSFGDSPSYGSPKFNRFSPNNYSSPQKFNNNPRQYNNNKRNNYRFSGGHYNRSYNNSNNSYNSSYNSNTRRRDNKSHNKSFQKGDNDTTDMSKYFDHTSLKDPWAELEANLKKKLEAEALENVDTVDNKNKEETVIDNAESSSTSDEEQETESESKSSSSGVDEETT